jgi:AraC-like DNA-binding protein
MENKLILAMHKNVEFVEKLKCSIANTYTVIEKQKLESILQEVRINHVACIIIYIGHDDIAENIHFELFKKKFSHIPCIAVIASPDMELARYCGSIGIECVLPYKEIHSIKEEIVKICAENSNKVFIEDLSIDKKNPLYSVILRESLLIMEKDYLKIFNINEIAAILRINESTLSREFSKFGLPSPKKILMFLKIRHAIKLMQNKGLNVREISSLSGFTDEKRMAECFHRMFGMAPGEYREKNIENEYIIGK